MFDFKTNDSAAMRAKLGVWMTPGYGKAYPELKDTLQALYADKVSRMNFVPAGWVAAVAKLQEVNPDDLIRIGPSMNKGRIIQENAPFTIRSRETAEAWQALFAAENLAVVTYAAGQQKAGKAQLDQLYRNAVFWNRAYQLGETVGIVQAQAGVKAAKTWFEDNDKKILWGGIAVAALAALWVLTPYLTPFIKGNK